MNEVIDATVVDVKKEVSLDDRLKAATAELNSIKTQIRQVEEQMVKNQQQLQAAKDQLMSKGLELQGQVKLLTELVGTPEAPKA